VIETTQKKRADVLRDEIARILPIIIEEYQPERIIVYGSIATRRISEWSDIDMLIIKDTDEGFFERIDTVLRLIKPRVGIDLLVYTGEEYEYLCMNRLFFKKEIIPNSEVLYAR